LTHHAKQSAKKYAKESSSSAVLLHVIAVAINGSRDDGKMFDMHLATAIKIREVKIAALDTYMSDIDMLKGFFVAL
jgi:hypothetical protein